MTDFQPNYKEFDEHFQAFLCIFPRYFVFEQGIPFISLAVSLTESTFGRTSLHIIFIHELFREGDKTLYKSNKPILIFTKKYSRDHLLLISI